jgi:hypothetical protein
LIFCILCSRCPWLVKTRLVCCYIWRSFLVVLDKRMYTHRHRQTDRHTHTHTCARAHTHEHRSCIYITYFCSKVFLKMSF